jgi:hypothetical protein
MTLVVERAANDCGFHFLETVIYVEEYILAVAIVHASSRNVIKSE